MAIRLLVGLGNPGPRYDRTRHNAGFWFVSRLAGAYDCVLREQARFQSLLARCRIGDRDCLLQEPLTFMNHSGQAVRALAAYHRIPPADILVVHDDLDLPPGRVRLKRGGGHGGHNGLRDLMRHLGDNGFWRLRLGIGHPGHRDQVVDYVLSVPRPEEREAVEQAIDAALEVVPLVLAGETERAMHRLHSPSA